MFLAFLEIESVILSVSETALSYTMNPPAGMNTLKIESAIERVSVIIFFAFFKIESVIVIELDVIFFAFFKIESVIVKLLERGLFILRVKDSVIVNELEAILLIFNNKDSVITIESAIASMSVELCSLECISYCQRA